MRLEILIERAGQGAVNGEHWRASWFDRDLNAFIGGSGGTPWLALSWAMVDRAEQIAGLVMIARNTTDTPEDALARASTTTSKKYTIAPTADGPKKRSAAARRSSTARKKKAS